MHKVSLPAWFNTRALFHFDAIEPRSTALLSIDMQVVFVEPGQPFAIEHAAVVAANTNRIIAALRTQGGTIAFTRHTVSDEAPYALPSFQRKVPVLALGEQLFRPGVPGHGVHRSMDVRPEDIVVDKYRFSAFILHSSNLHDMLQKRGVDTLIVTGVVTNGCCESSARDASMLGYKVLFVSDATATFTDEEHNAALLNVGAAFADVRPTASLLPLLRRDVQDATA